MTNKRTGNFNYNCNCNYNGNCNCNCKYSGNRRYNGNCRFLLCKDAGGQQLFLGSWVALRAATHPGLVTWRLRPRASAPSGTSSVMLLPAAT